MTEQAQVPSVITRMSIDKKDVVDVALAKIEAQIRKGIKDSDSDVQTIAKKIDSTRKDLSTLIGKTTTDKAKKVKAKFVAAMAFAGIQKRNMSVSISAELHESSDDGLPQVIKIRVYALGNKVYSELVDATAQMKSLHKLIVSLEDDLNDAKQVNLDWRKKLSDMPMMERQIKARVVENELNKSDEGKRIMEAMMNGGVDETIKKICG